MLTPVCIIRRYAYNTTLKKYDSEYIDITDISDVKFQIGYEDRKDTFSMELLPSKEYNSKFNKDFYNVPEININDMLDIYLYYEEETAVEYAVDGVTVLNMSDFLLFSGIVDNYNFQSNQGILSLTVAGNNRTEILLNNLTFFQYSSSNVPDMLTENGNKIRLMNPNKPIFMLKDYMGDGTDTPGSLPQAYNAINENFYNSYIPSYEKWGLVPRGGIRAYKKAAYEYDTVNNLWKIKSGIDLNAVTSAGKYIYRFPLVDYFETYKPLYTHLDVLSASSYTDDKNSGTYITYVETNNNMRWEPKSTEVDNDIAESDTSSTQVTNQIRDIVNAVIVNVGNDAKGRGILALAYDLESMTKYGAKWKYIAVTNISESFQKDQKEATIIAYNDDNNFPSSYPVYVKTPRASSIFDKDTEQPIWEYALDDPLNNDADFNEYIRKVVRELGKDYARDYIANHGSSSFNATMKTDVGTRDFHTGNYITTEVESIGWVDTTTQQLRIVNIAHTIGNTGWETILTLEQDREDIVK